MVWSKMTNSSPNQVFIDAAEHSAKKADSDCKRTVTDKAKEQQLSKYSRTDNTVAARKAYSRHDEGIVPDDVSDDVSPEFLDEMKTSYYQTNVVVMNEEVKKIERCTQKQAGSEQWICEWRKRLTASRVGGVAKMRKSTKRSKKV